MNMVSSRKVGEDLVVKDLERHKFGLPFLL